MHVLFVLNSLAPGGTEHSTVVLAARLNALGTQTTIVTLKSATHSIEADARAAGIRVVQLRSGSLLHQLTELRKVVRASEPDIIHTALFDADQLGRLAGWRTGIPVVSSLVSTPYDQARFEDPNIRRWRLRGVQVIDAVTGHLLVDRFHAVSEGTKLANARALRLPLPKISVAERGRDTNSLGQRSARRRSRVRRGLGLTDDQPVVLNLGRLDHQKGQSDLIRATEILAARLPSVVTLIAGKEGAMAAAIGSYLASGSVAARHVRLLGHRTDIGDLLSACDLLAISSYFEGTAGVALEALAMGVPVVSTDLAGLRGVLTDELDCLLVPPRDPPSLALAIERLLLDPDLAARLSSQGRRTFEERFTLDAAASRMLDLYQDVARSP